MKIAGVITLYHPNKDVVEHILSYLPEIEVLYVLDNSEQPNNDISNKLSSMPKIQYISFGRNTGISYALNYALKKAYTSGYEYLLTMDQDSSFSDGMMKDYKNCIEKYIEAKKSNLIAMFCVCYTDIAQVEKNNCKSHFILNGITSGSIVPIKLAIENGGFDENLFIDEVDSEYCYRMGNRGYKILEFPQIKLNHSLGNPTDHHILGYNYTTYNHNALRRYYITRNKIYVLKKYPQLQRKYIKDIIRSSAFILMGENDKLSKICMTLKGLRDGIFNRMGKYPFNKE